MKKTKIELKETTSATKTKPVLVNVFTAVKQAGTWLWNHGKRAVMWLWTRLKQAGAWLWKSMKQAGTWLWTHLKRASTWLWKFGNQAGNWLWKNQKRKLATISCLVLICLILSYFGVAALRIELIYQNGVSLFTETRYEAAAEQFDKTTNYKDTETYKLTCQQYIIYDQACLLMENGAYESAQPLFASLGDFEDASSMAERCGNFIIYEKAHVLMEYSDYEQARRLFASLGDFEDAQSLAKQCTYEYGQQLFDNGEFEKSYKIFKNLGNYRNSAAKVSLSSYYHALWLFENEKYLEAYEAFIALENYKDAAEKAALSLKHYYYNKTIDEIWPITLNSGNINHYYSSYLTYRYGDKWGIIDENLNVILYAKSEYPGSLCWTTEIHIDGWSPDDGITLKNGYTIGYGHGGGSVSYVYDIEKNAVFFVYSDEGGIDLKPVHEIKQKTLDAMPAVVPMRYVKQVEADWGASLDLYDYYGYCDRNGNVLTNERYDYADSFSDGVAAVMKNGKWGYINEKMQKVTGFKYDSCYGTRYDGHSDSITPGFAYAAVNGRIAVRDASGKFGVINTSGQQLLPCEYDSIVPLDNGNFFIKNDGKWEIKIF